MSISSVNYGVSSYYDKSYVNMFKSNSASNADYSSLFSNEETKKSNSSSSTDTSSLRSTMGMNMQGMSAMNRMQPPPPPPEGGGQGGMGMKDPESMTDDELEEVQSNMVEMYNSLKESGEDVSGLTDVSEMTTDDFKSFLAENKPPEGGRGMGMPPGGGQGMSMKSPESLTDDELSEIKDKMAEMYNSLKESGKDVSKLTNPSELTTDDIQEMLTQRMQEQQQMMMARYGQFDMSENASGTVNKSA